MLMAARLTWLLPTNKRMSFVQGPLLPRSGDPITVDWVSGACMLIRRDAWDAVGTLDEAFHLYGEELDWCWRAQRAGWVCLYVPDAVAHHVGGASARSTFTAREIQSRVSSGVSLAAKRNLPARQYWTWRAAVPMAKLVGRLAPRRRSPTST
jgi:GT2 family glycosyltransferase